MAQTLWEEFDTINKVLLKDKVLPKEITENINPKFELRPYQVKALNNFIYYFEQYPEKKMPINLLFHMATGSGKTLVMAAQIAYLYSKGYRNFMFFVNSTNILEKTKKNFIEPADSKYLFNNEITIHNKKIGIKKVDNFDGVSNDSINIAFTTIQGLHCMLNNHKENLLTLEDFKDKKIILISDEAHHINAWTKNGKLGKEEEEEKKTWEHTINNIFKQNSKNMLLEFTATVDWTNEDITKKYEDKTIIQYSLKEFRKDGYSKEVKVLQSDTDEFSKMLQAVLLSQYRRKVAEKHKIQLKPVILFKSKTIAESRKNRESFLKQIRELKKDHVHKIQKHATKGEIMYDVFNYFKENNITSSNLISELIEDFSEEKCISVDSKEESEKKQLQVNSLEDEDNEIRAIFAVDKLNEGWDVLNLFDIVRLYNTRDAKANKPGKTTIQEAQLIGRGARYYPFILSKEQEKYKRKYDQAPESELKILEELYYHSKNNPKYIQELTVALIKTGIIPDKTRTINLKVKPGFMESYFWKNGLLFKNKRIKFDKTKIRSLKDIGIEKKFKFNIFTGELRETAIFNEEKAKVVERATKNFTLGDFEKHLVRKAIDRIDFYKFDNLTKDFPNLTSIKEFISSENFLKNISVEVSGSKEDILSINNKQKLELILSVLNELSDEIKKEIKEYYGTKEFEALPIKSIVKDKQMRIFVDSDSDAEYGIGMSETTSLAYQLDLSDKAWYIYNENYGTSEEKALVKFVHSGIDLLEKKYAQVYLLRNQQIFQLYRFSDGRPLEPDFVLFLETKNKEKLVYQLFIEAKGTHLIATDKWKEEFLKEIATDYTLITIHENNKFKLVGLPFYNEGNNQEFINNFESFLKLKETD
jgi:type III restriction enzyme